MLWLVCIECGLGCMGMVLIMVGISGTESGLIGGIDSMVSVIPLLLVSVCVKFLFNGMKSSKYCIVFAEECNKTK